MSSTNKTTYYELSQYVGTDKPTYLSDYNSDMLKIDTGIHDAADDAATALTTANSAASTAADASTAASTATTTANTANSTANNAKNTAETAATNASAALTAAQGAQTAAAANTITNLAPAYDPTLTYDVDDLVTYIDDQGSGKMYKCIIAVSSPEAFNINKWDDVTTSEVYSRKPKLIRTVTSTGIESLGTLWGQICSDLPEHSDNYEYICKVEQPDSTIQTFREMSYDDNTGYHFFSVSNTFFEDSGDKIFRYGMVTTGRYVDGALVGKYLEEYTRANITQNTDAHYVYDNSSYVIGAGNVFNLYLVEK